MNQIYSLSNVLSASRHSYLEIKSNDVDCEADGACIYVSWHGLFFQSCTFSFYVSLICGTVTVYVYTLHAPSVHMHSC